MESRDVVIKCDDGDSWLDFGRDTTTETVARITVDAITVNNGGRLLAVDDWGNGIVIAAHPDFAHLIGRRFTYLPIPKIARHMRRR